MEIVFAKFTFSLNGDGDKIAKASIVFNTLDFHKQVCILSYRSILSLPRSLDERVVDSAVYRSSISTKRLDINYYRCSLFDFSYITILDIDVRVL